MEPQITLFGIHDDEETTQARSELNRLNGRGFEELICPPILRAFYVVPFVEDEQGESYFGIGSIRSFVKRALIDETRR